MEDKKILTINKQDGTTERVEEIISFEIVDINKRYVVYTKNEYVNTDNIAVYISRIEQDDTGIKLLGVETEEEWSKIKEVLQKLSNNGYM